MTLDSASWLKVTLDSASWLKVTLELGVLAQEWRWTRRPGSRWRWTRPSWLKVTLDSASWLKVTLDSASCSKVTLDSASWLKVRWTRRPGSRWRWTRRLAQGDVGLGVLAQGDRWTRRSWLKGRWTRRPGSRWRLDSASWLKVTFDSAYLGSMVDVGTRRPGSRGDVELASWLKGFCKGRTEIDAPTKSTAANQQIVCRRECAFYVKCKKIYSYINSSYIWNIVWYLLFLYLKILCSKVKSHFKLWSWILSNDGQINKRLGRPSSNLCILSSSS